MWVSSNLWECYFQYELPGEIYSPSNNFFVGGFSTVEFAYFRASLHVSLYTAVGVFSVADCTLDVVEQDLPIESESPQGETTLIMCMVWCKRSILK